MFISEGKTVFKCTASCVLVSKEERSKSSNKESGDAVQEEEGQPKADRKKCGVSGDSSKTAQGSSLVSAKKRKTVEMLEKKKKKKKKIGTVS